MRSSKISNEPQKIGKYLKRSLFFAVFGVPLGVIPQIYFETSSGALFLAIVFVPFFLSQLAYGNGVNFPDYNIERFKIFLRRLFKANKFNCDVDRWEGTSLKPDKNVLYSKGGIETYGYRIILDTAQSKPLYYQAFYQELLKLLEHGVTVKDAILSIPYSNEYIKKYRPTLIKKGICQQSRYLFVSFEPSTSKDTKAAILNKLSIGTRRLTAFEIAEYQELVAAPETPPSGREKATYGVTQRLDGKYIWPYAIDKVQGAISLCALPSEVTEDYNLILAPSLSKNTVITTTYKVREGFAESLSTVIKMFFSFSKLGMKSEAEKEQEDINRNRQAARDLANIYMYQSILMYDTPENIHNRTLELQNVRNRLGLSSNEAPVYRADQGFIERSFEAAMPSPWAYLPQRLQRIDSFIEASCYLPVEESIDTQFSPLMFRTIRNTPYFVDVQDTADATMIFLIGGMGTGKSTLIAQYADAQDYLEESGVETGYVCIDLGGSSAFLKDNDGVLGFDLAERDDVGEMTGFPIYPLHCCLDPEKKRNGQAYTTEEIELAVMQLTKLMGLTSYKNIAESRIRAAVQKMITHAHEFRLSTFRSYFYPFYKDKMESEDFIPETKMEWENSFELLNMFCAASKVPYGPWPEGVTPPVEFKAGAYGHIFDPEEVKYDSLGDFTRLYFNLNLSEERFKPLAKGFLDFAYLIGYSVCLKYASDSGQYKLFNFYIEEFQKQARYVDLTEILDLKNQSRKNGFLVPLTAQGLKQLIPDNLPEEQRKEIFEGIREVYFGNISFSDDRDKLEIIMTTEEEVLEDGMREISNVINFNAKVRTERKQALASTEKNEVIEEKARTYTIGYISPQRKVMNFYVDLEPHWLWTRTTHAQGKAIRQEVIEKYGISRTQAARLLTSICPQVPSKKMSTKDIEAIIKAVGRQLNG